MRCIDIFSVGERCWIHDRIGEHVVAHQARKYGTTKFGLERFANGMLDLLVCSYKVWSQAYAFVWFTRYYRFPYQCRYFYYIGGYKLYAMYIGMEAKNIRDFFILRSSYRNVNGCQLFLTGFVAEMISRTDQVEKNTQYLLRYRSRTYQ